MDVNAQGKAVCAKPGISANGKSARWCPIDDGHWLQYCEKLGIISIDDLRWDFTICDHAPNGCLLDVIEWEIPSLLYVYLCVV